MVFFYIFETSGVRIQQFLKLYASQIILKKLKIINMKKSLLFIFLLFYSTTTLSQVINPNDIVGVCSDQNIISPVPTGTNYNNLRTQCGGGSTLTNTLVLYYIEITAGTTFTFTVSPLANMDYDFASWKNPNLNNLGPADRGSQNDPNQTGIYTIGLSLNEPTETCELPGAGVSGLIPGMVRYYDVQPGDAILIAVNRWSPTDAGFVISFGGNASLNCSLFDLDKEKCDTDHNGQETFDLNEIATEIRNGSATDLVDFFTNETDAENPLATNVLPLSYIAFTANNPNTIYVRIKRANGVMKKVMTLKLFAHKVPIIEQEHLTFEKCDYDNDGKADFNLKSLENGIANGQTDLQFKYYENLLDATDNTANTITNTQNYNSGIKTIYIRVSINDKCPIIITLDLVVNPVAQLPITSFDYEECETNHQGTALFNLTSQETIITAGQTGLSFKYYDNLDEATNDSTNTINTPTTYTSDSKSIFARVKLNGKCPITVTINLIVNKVPQILSTKIDYEICDDNLDGIEIFDLKSYESILAQGQTDLEFRYYETLQNAQLGNTIEIENPESYTSKKKTVYIRIAIDGHCPTIVHLSLIPGKTKMSPSETTISEICGEETSDGLRYDLTRTLAVLLQGEKAEEYQITYYEQEDEARHFKNDLKDFRNYQVNYNQTRIIYVRFENKKGCFAISSILLDSQKRVTSADQYMKECDPYVLPKLPIGYSYYTQPDGPRGKGIELASNSSVFGKRTIYVYASSKTKETLINQSEPDSDECIYETSFTVYNKDCHVPKGISPNGDGKNDSWNLTPFGVTRLTIHNRYGKEVYKFAGSYTNQWQGQSNKGEALPHGTYWYSMEALNGELEGWIQIIR